MPAPSSSQIPYHDLRKAPDRVPLGSLVRLRHELWVNAELRVQIERRRHPSVSFVCLADAEGTASIPVLCRGKSTLFFPDKNDIGPRLAITALSGKQDDVALMLDVDESLALTCPDAWDCGPFHAFVSALGLGIGLQEQALTWSVVAEGMTAEIGRRAPKQHRSTQSVAPLPSGTCLWQPVEGKLHLLTRPRILNKDEVAIGLLRAGFGKLLRRDVSPGNLKPADLCPKRVRPTSLALILVPLRNRTF